MKKELTNDKITSYTINYKDIDPTKISIKDLDDAQLTSIYDTLGNISNTTSSNPYSWTVTTKTVPYSYTISNSISTPYEEDLKKLEEKLDDKLADMDGRLDILLNDCAFKDDLATLHTQISELLSKNNFLQTRIIDLTTENNNLSNELFNIKQNVNYLLTIISP